MQSSDLPRFPVYVPSKARPTACYAGEMFLAAGVPFSLVCEAHDAPAYRERFPAVPIVELPEANRGIAFVRQFLLDHARAQGHDRYWQVDDGISQFKTCHPTGTPKTRNVTPGAALRLVEDLALEHDAALACPDFMSRAAFIKDGRVCTLNSYAVCCTLTSTGTGVNYDGEFLCREDMDFCISHLRAGMRTLVAHRVAMIKRNMGSPGGIATVVPDRRAGEDQDDQLLHRKWGDLIQFRKGKRAVVLWKKLGKHAIVDDQVAPQAAAVHCAKERPPLANVLPRYPIYIPSKGRFDRCLTARFLERDGCPFHIVVEPQEHDAYASRWGEDRVLVLPWDNPGSVIPARNWIKEHATAAGYERHWQLDDNCHNIRRLWRGKRIGCDAGIALSITENFVERYTNVAIAGLNYTMFVVPHFDNKYPTKPFQLNCHVYSCTLVLNSIPYQWRGRYNEDTDLCLQVLSGGWCTILMNAFMIDKLRTMKMAGGNTETLEYHNDGRLRMARALERQWPGVVVTKRRFGRPQHFVRYDWRKFDTPLIRRPGLELPDGPDEQGLTLVQIRQRPPKEPRAPRGGR
jgi:hypothetical protein